MGKALDEVQHIDIAGGLHQLRLGDGFVAEADVFGDGAGKQERVLQNHGEVLPQVVEIVFAQIDAIEQNLPRGHFVEAHHQAGERGLSRPRVAHDGHRVPRLDGEGNILQNPVDVFEGGQFAARESRVGAPARRLTAAFCSGVSFW